VFQNQKTLVGSGLQWLFRNQQYSMSGTALAWRGTCCLYSLSHLPDHEIRQPLRTTTALSRVLSNESTGSNVHCLAIAMDPWNALSLAACIAQFIDFGSKLVSHARAVRKDGSPSKVAHLNRVTSELASLSKRIGDQSSRGFVQNSLRTADEKVDRPAILSTVERLTSSMLGSRRSC